MPDISRQIENLFENRYHGAINIKGIKFQILFSILKAFELYVTPSLDQIVLEGIEDIDLKGSRKVDLKGIQLSNQYLQIKTSGGSWHWSNLKGKKVLENFLDVWKLEPRAEFFLITNFGYKDKLDELVKFCSGIKTTLSKNLREELEKILQSQGLDSEQVLPFLQRLKFQRVSEEMLISQIQAAIVQYYDLEADNSELYLLALTARFLNWSADRKSLVKENLEEVKHFVQDQINRGTSNLAVQNGWIEKLSFASDIHIDDFYEGANARPGHILAGLDAERPHWLNEIKKALQETGTCILRTSSGQGKSTLLYRYAFQNYQPETTFVIKNIGDETMVAPIKQAILSKLTLGLPILVLIDNVRANLRFWHSLVREFTGYGIHFLVTIREEDWHRYSVDAAGLKWKIITPELSLPEAKDIYKDFQAKNRIAEAITSAEQCFEQVADRKLLLEFTYLITHGQMLSDRLREQVQKMHEIGEDKAKLQVLRLVCVAQIYQSKTRTSSLLENVGFSSDPDLTLTSLRKEYLLFTDDECEGLHLVRSQHLVEILHSVIPLEDTIKELIQILDIDNLSSLVSYVFSDIQVNHQAILQFLVDRCLREDLKTIANVTESLFTANERNYLRQNKHFFDEAKKTGGAAFLLAWATMPFAPYDVLADFSEIFSDNESFKGVFDSLAELRDRFVSRNWKSRTDVTFLKEILARLPKDKLFEDPAALSGVLNWCRLPEIDRSNVSRMLDRQDIDINFSDANMSDLAELLFNIYTFAPEIYERLLHSKKNWLLEQFKKFTETLTVTEKENDIIIEFIVDEGPEKKEAVHEQAINRLNTLYQMFPFYDNYGSQGLYIADFGVDRAADDTKKHIPLRTYQLGNEAAKNSIYQKMVDAEYAETSIFEWQKKWFSFRLDISELFGSLIEAGQAASLGKATKADSIDKQFRDVFDRCRSQSQLPDVFGPKIKNAQQNINSWARSVQTFLSQVFQDDEEKRRLCRINLRDAGSRLFKAQEAFNEITCATQTYFDFSTLEDGEIERYFYLADVFDVLYDDAKDTPIRDIKAYISKKRRKQIDAVNSALHTGLASLEDAGFSFTYPIKLLSKSTEIGGLETSICLGFEILDFSRAPEQVEIILRSFPAFEEHYWFLYLVPLLDGDLYANNIWRIAFHNISQLQSEGSVDQWALLPQVVNQEILSTFPKLKRIDIPEIETVARFVAHCMEFHLIRRTRNLLVQKLNGELESDKYLAGLYHNRLQTSTTKLLSSGEKIFTDLTEITEGLSASRPSNEVEAWIELMQACSMKYKEVTDFVNQDLSDEDNRAFWMDRQIDAFLGNYLNIKYKKISN